jgi:hypothetical protein
MESRFLMTTTEADKDMDSARANPSRALHGAHTEAGVAGACRCCVGCGAESTLENTVGWTFDQDTRQRWCPACTKPSAACPIYETQMVQRLRRAANRTTWEQGDGASTFEVKHPDGVLLEEAASLILALCAAAARPESLAVPQDDQNLPAAHEAAGKAAGGRTRGAAE